MNEIATKNLSLFQLESELVELMDFATEAQSEEERAAADGLIATYLEKRVDKVDAIRSFIRWNEMMALCARDEATEQTNRAKILENRAQRLKDACLAVMIAFDEKRLTGRTGELRLHKNPPSIEITNEDLLDSSLRNVTVKMPGTLWSALHVFMVRYENIVKDLTPLLHSEWITWNESAFTAEQVPDKKRIKAEMEKLCTACNGCGTWLMVPGDFKACDDCNGTGKQWVPGAKLVTDKQHLVVR